MSDDKGTQDNPSHPAQSHTDNKSNQPTLEEQVGTLQEQFLASQEEARVDREEARVDCAEAKAAREKAKADRIASEQRAEAYRSHHPSRSNSQHSSRLQTRYWFTWGPLLDHWLDNVSKSWVMLVVIN
jgi:hypothetical protein